MKRLLFLLSFVLLVGACDSFVEDVDDPIDSIADDELLSAAQTQFLINGVLDMFAESLDDITVLSDGLSDAFIFDQDVPNATFPTYRQVDEGDIQLDNNSVDGAFNSLGEYRLLADTLITRIERISELGPDEGGYTDDTAPLRDEALFVAYLHGGIARYFYATYFGLEPEMGGGVINRSPFIESDELYAEAMNRLDEALTYADPYQAKVVNTLKARIALFQGNFADALTYARQGLMEGDPDYLALYNVQDANEWYFAAGRGRNQYVANDRFANDEDPRSPVEPIDGNSGATFWRQAEYPEQGSEIPFLTWEDNYLLIAESLIQTQGDGNAEALERVNAVRAAYELAPLDAINLNVLLGERDQTLFARGLRLIDQRRYPELLGWHLPAGTWRYLPITQSERNDNPNL